MIPKREAVMQALQDRLDAVRIVALFEPDPRDLPVTLISDTGETAETNEYGWVTATISFTVVRFEMMTVADALWHTEANETLATMQQTLFTDETLGGLALDMQYTGNVINFSSETRIAEIQVSASLRYQYELGNPFIDEE